MKFKVYFYMFIKKYFLLLIFLILNFSNHNNINFSLAKEIEIEYSKSKKEYFKIPYLKNEIDEKKNEFKTKISEGDEFNSKDNDDFPIKNLNNKKINNQIFQLETKLKDQSEEHKISYKYNKENKKFILNFLRPKNKNKVNKVFFNLSKNDFYKLNELSLDSNDVKEINNIIEQKFNKLENLLGRNKFTTQDKDFSFNAFQNINRNFRRLNKVNEQLDYITKTLQVMGYKVN